MIKNLEFLDQKIYRLCLRESTYIWIVDKKSF